MNTKDKVSFVKMRSAFLFGLMVLLSIGFLYLLRPFFYPIFWAAITAIMFYPLYKKIHTHLKMNGLSAVITLLLFVVTIFLPLTLLALLFISETSRLYLSFNYSEVLSNVQNILAYLKQTSLGPLISVFLEEWTKYAEKIITFLQNSIFSVFANIGNFVVMFVLMLYMLYYFLKDGEKILQRGMHLSPLSDAYERMLYQQFTSTARATLKSTVIIGGIQGVLGGLLFWLTGISGAFIWGVIMVLLSIIPAVGPFLVWFPAGLIMIFTGHIVQGIIILIFGGTVISTLDNILRPPLIGRDIQMHPVIVLLSTLGGLALFNISGFIIGPIIAALFQSVVSIYDYYYRNELQNS